VKDESKATADDDMKHSRSPDFVTPKSSPPRQDDSRSLELPDDPTTSVDSNPRHESMDAIERDMIEKMTANIAKVEAVFEKDDDDEENNEILYGDAKKSPDENRTERT